MLAETEAGSLDVSLDWDDVDGATDYRVRWRGATSGEGLNEGVEVESSDAEITVADYGKWLVRVQACNNAGCGSPVSSRVTVEPAADPAPSPTPTPDPTQPNVSITANPANPVVEEAVTLSAVITDAPSGLEPSYRWELDLAGTWFSMGTGPTFSYLTAKAESQAFRVTVSYDSGASATSAPLTVTWSESTSADTPVPPTFDEGAGPLTRSVAENSPKDTAVGSAVGATDPNGDTLTYTLTGTDAGSFTIDDAGRIKVGQGTTLDYETKTGYSVTVNVSDGKDAQGDADTAVDASVEVGITVTDVMEPPLAPSDPRVTGVSTTGFTVEWDPPDNAGRPAITEFELKSEAPDSTVTTHKTPDDTTDSISLGSLDPGTTYDLTLRARNDEGDGARVTLTATTLASPPDVRQFHQVLQAGREPHIPPAATSPLPPGKPATFWLM